MLTEHELQHAIGKLYGSLYWDARHRRLVRDGTHKREDLFGILADRPAMRREYRQLSQQHARGEYAQEVNKHGNIIQRGHHHNGERYQYDFGQCSHKKGWVQYDTDQDAWYFGVWVHPERRLIFTYAEGDTTLTRCPTEEGYHAELAEMAEFYGAPPPSIITIDHGGQVTKHFDTRPV